MPKFEPVIVSCPLCPLTGEIEETNGDKLDEYVKLKPDVLNATELVLF